MLFGIKHLCLLVTQTGMAHLRFDFFFNKQRQEVHVNWNFLLELGFQKDFKGEWGVLKDMFFKKNIGVIENIF